MINSKKAGAFINALILILAFLILFYFTALVLKFKIAHLPQISLALLVIVAILTSFSFGVFFVSRRDLSGSRELLIYFVVFNLFLFILTMVTAVRTALFAIVAAALLLPLGFNLFILGLLLRRSPEKETPISDSEDRGLGNNKRRTQRITDHISVQHLGAAGNWQTVKVYDFSATGVRLIMAKPLATNEVLDLKIIIPNDSRPVFAKARVVWSKAFSLEDKEFHIGAQFIEIDPADVVRLTLKEAYNLFKERIP